ncbi:MFS transporter [Spongiactinospora sp. TRM90649]|uniref:MFS transporter n=1 Tax=Spongiactinospora sp. TRM90649 TaxID=3031114 RepID=UPI0023F7005C|nr:MFS transporter [Spongiactinospora sp. TRM90649]MDF5751146.1 MFS transporter [Spongiactinospora sp. TRM90649]
MSPDAAQEQTSPPASAIDRTLGLTGLCLGTALIIMEANVTNVAIPAIRTDFHAGPAEGLWAIDAYTLVFAALLLSAGRLGDRIGARRGYLTGLGVFTAASIACSLAPDPGMLVLGRACQGLGAALLAPAPLTLISRMFTATAERTRAISIWVSVGGIGFMIGPFIGGLLLDTFGWRSIFLLNVPVAAATGWLVVRYVAEVPLQRVSFDIRGQAIAITGLTATVWALVESSVAGWLDPAVLTALVGGIAALLVFIAAQFSWARGGREVLLPPALIAERPVLAGLLAGATYNFSLYGMLIVYTFNFQQVRGYSGLQAGLAFLPLTVAATLASAFLGARFITAFGPRTSLATGMTLSAIGLGFLTVASAPYPLIAAGLCVFSTGMGLSAPSQTLVVMTFAPDRFQNMGSSALNTARQTGGAIGVALLGAIVTADPARGTLAAITIAIVTCLITATAALRLIPGRAPTAGT